MHNSTDDDADLNLELIEQLFRELDTELGKTGDSAEIYITGGARMMYGLSPERVTKDVDAVIRDGRDGLQSAATKLQREHQLRRGWLNDNVTGLLPASKDRQEEPIFQGRHLTVHGASPRRMLALKIASLRDKDHDDIRTLMAATGATTFENVERIVSDEYQDEGPGAAALLKLRLATFREELQKPDNRATGTVRDGRSTDGTPKQ